MPLSDVREQFAKMSGRYDLVNTDGSDNGADWYINKGQRWLEMHELAPVVYDRLVFNLQANVFHMDIPQCRAIHEVWINDDETKVRLDKKDLNWIKEEYSSTVSVTGSSAPLYWALGKPRAKNTAGFPYTFPITFTNSIEAFSSLGMFLDWIYDETEDLTHGCLIIAPPPEEEITMDIVGTFFSPQLNDDDSESWWTENYDDILLMSALRKLEIFYRNSAGVRDWTEAIVSDLKHLDFSTVEKETYHITEIEG